MANTVGAKGQLVIEKPIREALGIEAGSTAVQTVKDDHIEIRFYPPEHKRSLRGILSDAVTKSVGDRDWSEIREEAWAAAAEEKERFSR
ncbi:MAG TPA: AbrB/MazE/SpoVT family DNA-binding domain-containing protein [Thermoanaerobaculia bacterium]|jgi:AbrB family looped-hinge helix DNA binding protein|nr:AbrB/MazE/SpoVT family DNA-binding domain-containing protein [Thermoanaerobaculia bacterium]